MEQNEFKMRCYEKGELAQLYFPNLDKRRAVQKLRRWIYRCLPLMDELEHASYHPACRCFSTREVRLIVYYLGEP